MSNEKQETIWDIVAEMRRDCPARHMDGTRYRDGDWVYTKGTVEKLADRIETAFTREINARLRIDNSCVAQCAVLLDDHIKAIVSEVKKKYAE